MMAKIIGHATNYTHYEMLVMTCQQIILHVNSANEHLLTG